jgi:hypothetical protein
VDEESGLFGPQPSVRRLCGAVAGDGPGLLAAVCRTRFPDLLCLTAAPDGVELAVASPGVDEPGLVRDLVATLRERAAGLGPGRTVLLALHVGIVRVVADRFAGAGTAAALDMATRPEVRAAVAARPRDAAQDAGPRLAVVLAEGLYQDLRGEGLVYEDWQRVPGWTALRFRSLPAGRRPFSARGNGSSAPAPEDRDGHGAGCEHGHGHAREQEHEHAREESGNARGVDG